MSKLDTNHVVNLDLVKDRVNGVIKFGLADVETSDFFVGLYNNGSRVFDKDYIVTLYIVKPNGTFRNIKLEPKEGLKKYYCNLPDTLKNIVGEYVCQVMVFDNLTGEKKISKSKFKYSVSVDLASEMAGIIDEEEQESILTNILNRLLTLENPVEPYATQKHVDECVSTLTEEIDTIKEKDTEQDGKLSNIESKNTEQDGRLDNVESKNTEQDNRLTSIESKNTEQDGRLTTIEAKNIEQDGRLDSLENRVDGIDEKIADTIEPSLDNHGNRLDTLEAKDLVHESRMTNIESKNVEQDNRLTSIEGINTTQNNRLDALETKDIAHESRMTNIESKNIEQDERLSNIENKNVEQDSRLDVAENRLANIGDDITNTMQPIIDAHASRLDAIEAIDVAQNNRLDAIEVKNQQQDDRLLDIEKVNKKQDIDIKCLYGASQTIDVTKEGNSVYLQNSNNGFTIVDEIKGNTLINCNKEPDKELILNGNINASGDNTITINEGVDGGKVDVALEGNTLVNVSKTKDSTALPLEEELTYLYPSTSYTVQFVSDGAITVDITLGGTRLLAQNIVAGLNRISITTPSELVDNKLVISGVGAKISEAVVTDTNREFGYFEGMKSVGECEELEVVSRNVNMLDINKLADNNNWLKGNYWSYPIKVKPNTNYTVSMTGNKEANIWLGIFGVPFAWKDPIDITLWNANITENTNYTKTFNTQNRNIIYINMYDTLPMNAFGEDGKFKNVYLSETSLYNGYIPHQSNTQQLTHEPLRAVGNVKDRYVLIDGKWYIERKCGEVVLDGSDDEGWNVYGGLKGDASNTWVFGSKFNPYRYTDYKFYPIYNDKLKTINPSYDYNKEMIYGIKYSYYNLWIHLFSETFGATKNTSNQEAINLFKQYMQQNPLKIIGQLATPTYEPIDYNPFTVYSDITHISNNSTIPCNMTIKNTGYNCLLKPSTTYTVSSNLGLNTVTTPNTLTEDCLHFYDTDTSDVTKMKDVTILEGDYTTGKPIPSHFSGIESAFEQEYDEEKGKYKVKIRIQNEDASKENYIEFYIDEPLRGIGDVKDKVYVKDDKVVVERNCGSVTFDGSDDEGWSEYENLKNTLSYYTNTTNMVKYSKGVSNNFIIDGRSLGIYNELDIETLVIGESFRLFIYINKAKLQTQDTAGFKQWLQQNPTTVVYPLAEPTYEEVEYNDVKLFIESFKNSTLFYNSNVPVTSKLYYSYSVPIVDKVARTASISDEQDQLIIDLATQCAVMEMYLM